MRRHDESSMQKSCIEWFRLQYPKLARLMFAVPNGGRRDLITGAKMKAEGAMAGVADLLFLYPSNGFHGLCIEMKTATGRQQPTQKQWQSDVEAVGYKYVICRSLDDFVRQVNGYMSVKFPD